DYEEADAGHSVSADTECRDAVAMKPLNVSHVKGELIEDDIWNKKKILYKNAFGDNIDLEVIAKNIGFDKLVVINEKPKELTKNLEFSFEINLADFEVESEGKIWNEEEPLETSNKIILKKLKDTWFREFRVWDSAGKSGKIRVRIEKAGAVCEDTECPIRHSVSGEVSQNKYIFTKIIDKEFLENAVYPVYTDDTVSYYVGAGDGIVNSPYGSWATAQDAATGSSIDYTSSYSMIIAYHELSGNYTISRSFFPIDTSSINDDANITEAIFKVRKYTTYNDDDDGDDFMVVVQTNQSLMTELSTADYNQCGNVVDNPTEGSNRIDLGSIIYGYNSFILNEAGMTWIDKTGWTKLGLREGHDVIDSAINPVNDTINGL
ncbi:hypothetical protein KA005_41565, partial [bacterium]|nr:hypothetical protein [bacterium]